MERVTYGQKEARMAAGVGKEDVKRVWVWMGVDGVGWVCTDMVGMNWHGWVSYEGEWTAVRKKNQKSERTLEVCRRSAKAVESTGRGLRILITECCLNCGRSWFESAGPMAAMRASQLAFFVRNAYRSRFPLFLFNSGHGPVSSDRLEGEPV